MMFMPQAEKNRFIFWKNLSDFINDDNFKYIDSNIYNKKISQLASETYELLLRDDINISLYDYFLKKNKEVKAFIYIVLEDILFNDDFKYTLTLDSTRNKEIIEEALNTISVQLQKQDYDFPSNNDYSDIINDFKSKKIQNTYQTTNNYDDILRKQFHTNYEKLIDKQLIYRVQHNIIYYELNLRKLEVWRDYKNSTIYFRVKPFEDKQKTDKAKLSNYLSNLLNKNIEIYDSTNDMEYSGANNKNYLIISFLPMVKMEVFDPSVDLEFPEIINNMLYKNTFEYTTFLKKRHLKPIEFIDIEKGIIVQFIKQLSQNVNPFSFIMHWLANFFQNLSSSKICLVLIGDEETTNTFIYDIIKPIFAHRNKYLSIINDESLKNTNDSLIRDKVFYHISNISTSNGQDKRTSNLVLEILSQKYKVAYDAWENNESFINGELIVTSSKDTPYSFLKDSYTSCVVFKVKHLDTILKKMKIDRISLKRNIFENLDNFANILATYPLAQNYHNVVDIEEKSILPTMKNGILRTATLNKQIVQFIDAIRSNNLNSFKKIEQEESNLYQEFKYNFQNKMIAQPLLSTYFNIMFDEIIFPDNSVFLEILKEKAEMFKQAPNDKSKYNGKKRYPIF